MEISYMYICRFNVCNHLCKNECFTKDDKKDKLLQHNINSRFCQQQI